MNELALNFLASYAYQNSQFFGDVLDNEYIYGYCVIGFHIANHGIVFEDAIFINDLEDEGYPDQSQIFLVSEISDNYIEIKKIVEVL